MEGNAEYLEDTLFHWVTNLMFLSDCCVEKMNCMCWWIYGKMKTNNWGLSNNHSVSLICFWVLILIIFLRSDNVTIRNVTCLALHIDFGIGAIIYRLCGIILSHDILSLICRSQLKAYTTKIWLDNKNPCYLN